MTNVGTTKTIFCKVDCVSVPNYIMHNRSSHLKRLAYKGIIIFCLWYYVYNLTFPYNGHFIHPKRLITPCGRHPPIL